MHLKFFQYPPRSDASSVTPPAAPKRERWFPIGFWKRQVRTWHWMSGAVCLIGMLLFALTGITLSEEVCDVEAPTVTALCADGAALGGPGTARSDEGTQAGAEAVD